MRNKLMATSDNCVILPGVNGSAAKPFGRKKESLSAGVFHTLMAKCCRASGVLLYRTRLLSGLSVSDAKPFNAWPCRLISTYEKAMGD